MVKYPRKNVTLTSDKTTSSLDGVRINLRLEGHLSDLPQHDVFTISRHDIVRDDVYLSDYGKDFEIAEYANNINKGDMSVTIRGIGENYSGVKTFKVKIVAREMKKAE